MSHDHLQGHHHEHKLDLARVVDDPERPLPTRHRLNRRAFLTELGRGTLAITILGTAAVACSGDDEATPSTTAAQGDRDGTSTTATTQPEALEWHRVDLGFVSAYVLVRGREAAIVDTGVAGSEGAIGQTLTDVGVEWGAVDHVVLTHFHPDHAGSVGAVLGSATGATAYAGEADVALIQSPRPLMAVNDGDDVFGLEIVATPGHTPGHIAVLDHESGLLVVGDALTGTPEGVGPPNPQFTSDMGQANASVKKLGELDYDTVVFGHGDPVEGAADQQVAALAATL